MQLEAGTSRTGLLTAGQADLRGQMGQCVEEVGSVSVLNPMPVKTRKAGVWVLRPFIRFSNLGGDIQPPVGHCPHPSNHNPIARDFTRLNLPVNQKYLASSGRVK